LGWHELLALLLQALELAKNAAMDGYEIARPYLHETAKGLADFFSK